MKMRSALILVGASMSLGLLASALPASAATSSPAMQSCSDDWSKMKAANKVPDGQTWSQCSKDYAAAHPDAAAAAPAADTKAAKTTANTTAKTTPAAPAAADAKAGGKSGAMQSCSDDWAKLKAANKVPAGQTWPKFWSQCSKDYAAANPDGAAAPAAKAGSAKAATTDEDLGMALPDPDAAAKLDTGKTTAGKRQMTPGQQAAVVRIRACGAEWQAKKAAGKLPEGAKWPQYWSDCNKRLKAKGQ